MSTLFAIAARQWQDMRDAYNDLKMAEYDRAEEATRGAMVNREALRAGLNGWELMHRNMATVRRYGSPELVEYLATHPKVTLAQFESEYYDG